MGLQLQMIVEKNFNILPKKSLFFHKSTQKHFGYIVEIRDIKSLVRKSKKMTKIGVKNNRTVIF